jgi:tRNA (cmo5U34)-methyltransferase
MLWENHNLKFYTSVLFQFKYIIKVKMNTDQITAQFNKIAEEYDSRRRTFIPCFDDFYETSISFLSYCKKDFKTILDLGAGTGLLAKYLYDKYPEAEYILSDVSALMLDVARKRFSGLPNFSFEVNDYTKSLPDKKFDLIASALSIHHLQDQEKTELYNKIYDSLTDGGFFINLDQFNPESEKMNNMFEGYWALDIMKGNLSVEEMDGLKKRRALDREDTITGTLTKLKNAGFSITECIYSYMKFGVIIAIK